jgi:alpha-amylase/alpha-mannosidase (GH57 family)
MNKYVCIHGHFYQPPRENPWLEAVELQDSAFPYHDWNERITAECYAPNAVARLLDGDGRIEDISSNYSRMSFNFGPTLLSWLKDKQPDIHGAIVESDKKSRDQFGGHGSAIAQAYNHMILPLANARDKETQVIWGIRDFESRFNRAPEGMWLAETAADNETLDVLARHGIKFTILSPYQASRIRPLEETAEWQDVNGARVDPTVPYCVKLPEGRSIAVFFYDAPVSSAVAFEKLLVNGEKFAGRLLDAFDEARGHDQLVHIATDGESYGHHFQFGDMALAYALHQIETSPDIFHRTKFFEHVTSQNQSLLVQPVLRAATEQLLCVTLQLTPGNTQSLGKLSGMVSRLAGQCLPLTEIITVCACHALLLVKFKVPKRKSGQTLCS